MMFSALSEKRLIMAMSLILVLYHPGFTETSAKIYTMSKYRKYIYHHFNNVVSNKYTWLSFFGNSKPILNKAPEKWYYKYHGILWEISYFACSHYPVLSRTWIGKMGHGRNMLMWHGPRIIWTIKKTVILPIYARLHTYSHYIINPDLIFGTLIDPRVSIKEKAHLTCAIIIAMGLILNTIVTLNNIENVIPLKIILGIIGATYYVNPTIGSDTYDGTSRTYIGGLTGPWATMAYTDAHISPGDTAYYEGGEEFGVGAGEVLTAGSAGNFKTHSVIGTGYALISNSAHQIYMHNYTKLIGFHTKDCSNRSILINGYHDVYVQYCKIENANSQGIISKDGIYYNIFVDYNIVFDCSSSGISFEGYDSGGNHPYDMQASNNEIYNCYGDQLVCHDRSSVITGTLTDCKLFNNWSHDRDPTNTADYIDLVSGSADCYCYDNDVDGAYDSHVGGGALMLDNSAQYWTIYRNNFEDINTYQCIIYIGTPHITFWGNRINPRHTCTGDVVDPFIINDDNQYGVARTVTDIKVYKNTIIYWTATHPEGIRIADTDGNLGTVDISYNIFSIYSASYLPNYWIRFNHSTYRADDADFTANKNLYDSTVTFSVLDYDTARNWTYWTTTLGHDALGIVGLPLFVSATNNRLSGGSSAIGLGPGTSTYIPDLDGTASDNDAGAFEYVISSIIKRFGGLRGFGGTRDFGR